MKNTMKKPVNIPVSRLRPFEGHPFKVKDDEEMNTFASCFLPFDSMAFIAFWSVWAVSFPVLM